MLNQRQSRQCPFLLAWQERPPLRTTGGGGGHRQTGNCNVGETKVTEKHVVVGEKRVTITDGKVIVQESNSGLLVTDRKGIVGEKG